MSEEKDYCIVCEQEISEDDPGFGNHLHEDCQGIPSERGPPDSDLMPYYCDERYTDPFYQEDSQHDLT